MARSTPSQPTQVELEILSFLWESGVATAREVHNALAKNRDTNYSTTVKMLAVMYDKGHVKRDESKRPIQFRAAASQKSTCSKLLKNLAQKAYDGSMGSLVLQALSSRKASPEELDEIRRLLDQIQEKKR